MAPRTSSKSAESLKRKPKQDKAGSRAIVPSEGDPPGATPTKATFDKDLIFKIRMKRRNRGKVYGQVQPYSHYYSKPEAFKRAVENMPADVQWQFDPLHACSECIMAIKLPDGRSKHATLEWPEYTHKGETYRDARCVLSNEVKERKESVQKFLDKYAKRARKARRKNGSEESSEESSDDGVAGTPGPEGTRRRRKTEFACNRCRVMGLPCSSALLLRGLDAEPPPTELMGLKNHLPLGAHVLKELKRRLDNKEPLDSGDDDSGSEDIARDLARLTIGSGVREYEPYRAAKASLTLDKFDEDMIQLEAWTSEPGLGVFPWA